jgi:hypothetical protein
MRAVPPQSVRQEGYSLERKTTIAVAVLILVFSMVLPVVPSVKLPAGKCVAIDRTLTADGSPIPPYPPKGIETLVVA